MHTHGGGRGRALATAPAPSRRRCPGPGVGGTAPAQYDMHMSSRGAACNDAGLAPQRLQAPWGTYPLHAR
eukprot:3405583-Prymnesium_polylepis.1